MPPLFTLSFPAIDPVAITIGPLSLHWYALAYLFGLLGALAYGKRRLSHRPLWGTDPHISTALWEDFLIWATFGLLLGGRLGYVLMYYPQFYLSYPLEIFKLWKGGMSFHGGFLGVLLASILFTRRFHLPLLRFLDLLASGAPIGLGLGRLANFINGELYGRVTSVPWAMVFPGAGPEPRHPSQLYEAFLEGVLLFWILKIASDHFKALQTPGRVAGLFAIGYGLSRFTMEWFREPDSQLGYFGGIWTMGMILSLPLILGGIVLWKHTRKDV